MANNYSFSTSDKKKSNTKFVPPAKRKTMPTFLYCVKANGKYLNNIEANEHYSASGTAPTMGVRHSFCEYKTIWGKEPKYFEYLTLSNYIKILLEENRWGTRNIKDFKVIRIEQD